VDGETYSSAMLSCSATSGECDSWVTREPEVRSAASHLHINGRGIKMCSTPKLRLVLVLAGVLLFGAACEASNDAGATAVGDRAVSATTTAAAAPSQPLGDLTSATDADDLPAQAETDASTQERGGEIVTGVGSLTPTDIGRDIVFTAQITVAADDVAAAAQAALDAVAPLGGLLFGQQTTTEPLPRTVLVIKVLPEDFQEALSRLGGVGRLRSQNVNTDDVTERVVDLESRIVTSETSVERLRVLLGGAVGLDEVTAIERELLAREQSLEQLRGQLRTIRDAVGLATITMTVEQLLANTSVPSLDVVSSFYVGADDARACPARHRTIIREGDIVTACFEVTNTGGSELRDVQVADRNLGIDRAELISQAPGAALLPGETWIFAATFEATESVTTETRVTAIVTEDDPSGVDQGVNREGVNREGVNTVGIESITVEQTESLPGFGDSVGAGLGVLRLIIGVLIVAVGLTVPFLWLVPIAGIVFWIARRRDRNSEVGVSKSGEPGSGVEDGPEPDQSISAESQSSA